MRKALTFLFLMCFSSESKDLGIFGETFAISEKDLLDQIGSRLNELQATGKLEQEQKMVTERIKHMILHPQQVMGIAPVQVRREYKFDPTIKVTMNLSDHRGIVFAKKGDQFNPLDRISLSKALLFIDGDDEKQVKWAVSKINDTNLPGHEFSKIILIKGCPLDLQKQLNRNIYFDQHGLLTSKFGIEHVPAIVFQKLGETVLTIIEEVISGEGK